MQLLIEACTRIMNYIFIKTRKILQLCTQYAYAKLAMIFFGGENVVYSIAALQSWEQPFLSVLVFLVYVFICFRSMNEDLCACWTRFYLEKFPVRRFLCELIWVECRVMWFQLLCTGLLTSDQVYLLLYVYVHDSAEMLLILFKLRF